MATYLMPGKTTNNDVRTRKAPIVLMVDFELPEDVKEAMGQAEVCAIEGRLAKSFYMEPQRGDCLVVEGHLWTVTGRIIYPYPHCGKGDRIIPLICVEYSGRASEELYP